MLWIFRMFIKGLMLLLAAAIVRGCDQPSYSMGNDADVPTLATSRDAWVRGLV